MNHRGSGPGVSRLGEGCQGQARGRPFWRPGGPRMAPLPSTSVKRRCVARVGRCVERRRSGERLCTGRRRDTAAKLQTSPTDPTLHATARFTDRGGSSFAFPPHARRSPRSSRGPLASHAPSAWRWVERRPVSAWAAALPTVARRPLRLPPRPALRGLAGSTADSVRVRYHADVDANAAGSSYYAFRGRGEPGGERRQELGQGQRAEGDRGSILGVAPDPRDAIRRPVTVWPRWGVARPRRVGRILGGGFSGLRMAGVQDPERASH